MATYTVHVPDGTTRTTSSKTMANAMAANSGGTVTSSSVGSGGGSSSSNNSSGGGSYSSGSGSSNNSGGSSSSGGSNVTPTHNGGWAYTDKYGFSHVVSDRETAEQYGVSGSQTPYQGTFTGGYAVDASGNRVAVNTPGVIDYGNSGGTTALYDMNGNPVGGFVGGQQYDYDAYQEALKKYQQEQQNQNAYQNEVTNKTYGQAPNTIGGISNVINQGAGLYTTPGADYKAPKQYSATIDSGGSAGAISRYRGEDIWKNK